MTAATDEICALSAVEMAAAIRDGRLSSREAAAAALERIAVVQPALNAFALVLGEEAMDAAAAADAAQAAGAPLGPLHGLPVAFKDFTPTAGHRTTRGSVAFADWIAPADLAAEPAIVRRFRAAGAVLVAKTTTPEFAFSSFTHSPLHGVTRNPWDPTRTSGGSSGGSAVAAVTGCVALAEGTDMGGSVRIPAAACGCVGLKPSLGRIPMDILPTVFDSMSHFGPLARTVADAALFLQVAEGPDEADILSQLRPASLPEGFGRRKDADLRGLRIALSRDLGLYAVDPRVVADVEAAAATFAAAGAEIVEARLPWGPDVVEAWTAWWGVYQAAAFGHLLPEYRDRMDPELVRLMEAGFALDAVAYRRIEHLRSRIWRDLAAVFADCAALLTATIARPAPSAQSLDREFEGIDADGKLLGFDMTSPFNMLAPCPALSVPVGRTEEGWPTAAQIVGRRGDDAMVLRLGAVLERARPSPPWAPELLTRN